MTQRRIDITIDQIDLAAMPPGGERRLREAVAHELARVAGKAGEASHLIGRAGAAATGQARASRGNRGADAVVAQIASRVRAEVARGGNQ